jgi:hypothetical protein
MSQPKNQDDAWIREKALPVAFMLLGLWMISWAKEVPGTGFEWVLNIEVVISIGVGASLAVAGWRALGAKRDESETCNVPVEVAKPAGSLAKLAEPAGNLEQSGSAAEKWCPKCDRYVLFRRSDGRLGCFCGYRTGTQLADPQCPPLSEPERDETRRTYARLPNQRLNELLQSRHELRPGAEELLREELKRRASQ